MRLTLASLPVYRLSGSKPRSPGMKSGVRVSLSAVASTVAEKMMMPMKKRGFTLSRPPLTSDGAFSPAARRYGCRSSDTGHPAAASIARRPCLISASRYCFRVGEDGIGLEQTKVDGIGDVQVAAVLVTELLHVHHALVLGVVEGAVPVEVGALHQRVDVLGRLVAKDGLELIHFDGA